MEGRRERRRTQMELFGISQLEGQAKQKPVGIGADVPHQSEQGGVGADENMLAIVERSPASGDATRATSEHGAAFENGDALAALRERHRCREAGVPSTDYGYVRSQVEIAIHSLRIGVSDVRWVSTLKPSAATSSSTVR